MAIRYLKICLVLCVAGLGLFYALQNLVNLEAVEMFVATVLSMEGHAAYPNAFGPAVTSGALVWAAIAVILAGEFLVGLVSLKGAWDMFAARKADAARFNASKTFGVLGAGLALIVWFGLFSVIGGAYFQMWQTELGNASLAGSFQYLGAAGLVLLFVNQPDV